MARGSWVGAWLVVGQLGCLGNIGVIGDCVTQEDCAKGYACVSGRCAAICRFDHDCAAAERCEGQICVADPSAALAVAPAAAAETAEEPPPPSATLCQVEAAPAVGTVQSTFDLSWSSNGADCALLVDGVTVAAGCSGTAALDGAALGVGVHAVALWVATGPAGGTRCDTTLQVDDLTWCELTATPASGDLSTALSITSISNGSGCRLEVDGADWGPRPCTTEISLEGWSLGPGLHELRLYVGAGPTGAAQCSTEVTLADSSYCWLEVSPPSGDSNTRFTWESEANGQSCVWYWNDVQQYAINCHQSFDFFGYSPGPGDHTVRVVATGGPSGGAQCSASFHVEEATWCDLELEPAAGLASTAFVWQGSSNGDTCAWSVDGVDQGATPCNGANTFYGEDFGSGTHTLSFVVSTGPTGARTCTETFIVY
jgi:hypothetical protein